MPAIGLLLSDSGIRAPGTHAGRGVSVVRRTARACQIRQFRRKWMNLFNQFRHNVLEFQK